MKLGRTKIMPIFWATLYFFEAPISARSSYAAVTVHYQQLPVSVGTRALDMYVLWQSCRCSMCWRQLPLVSYSVISTDLCPLACTGTGGLDGRRLLRYVIGQA